MDLAILAIAEPRRRDILRLISYRELTSGAIAAQFDVTGPAISQHLRVLTEAGLVTVRRSGTRRFYTARPEAIHELRQYLADLWTEGLELLASEAEADERRLNLGNPN